MKTIWKYSLSLETNSLAMPKGAKLLSVGNQPEGSGVVLWALVDPTAPSTIRTIRVIGTGWELQEDPGTFVGTVQESIFVWHVFDGGERE